MLDKNSIKARSTVIALSVLTILSLAQSGHADVEPSAAPAAAVAPAKEGLTKSYIAVGTRLYVSANSANLRASPSKDGKYLESLVKGDQVEVLDLVPGADGFIKVKIISAAIDQARQVGTAFMSLSVLTMATGGEDAPVEDSRYFVIQNIASEKTRVYKRCTAAPGCSHELIFETDMVVGKPEEGTRDNPHQFKTRVGKGLLADWIKFYGNDHYPPWYSPSDEKGGGKLRIPAPGKLGVLGSLAWFDKDYMDSEYRNVDQPMKGAFGWYMAQIYPADAVDQQWIHGTLGWGSDQGKAIEVTRGVISNIVANPGSHGCTRLENQAVAFLRSFLPVGTPIYRIYAREAMAQAPVIKRKWKFLTSVEYRADAKEPGQWDWILTKIGAQKSMGLTADAKKVLESGIKKTDASVIETGTYTYDRTPDASGIDFSKESFSGKSGDRYELAEESVDQLGRFKGFFLVDVGQLDDYKHPTHRDGRIVMGGLPEFQNSVPDYLTYQGPKNYYVPAPIAKPKPDILNGQGG